MSKTIFSSNLRRARNFHEMSQEQAASACKISLKSWMDLEDGLAEPGITLLMKLSDGLAVENIRALISDPHFLNKPGTGLETSEQKDARIRGLEDSLSQISDFIQEHLGTKKKGHGKKKAGPEPAVLYSGGVVVNM